MIEQLTVEERECADLKCQECSLGRKGLRIIDALTAENAALRAEVERLQEEKRLNDTDLANWRATAASLASATKLLERAADELEGDIYDDEVVVELRGDLRAFLAAQPAALLDSLGNPVAWGLCQQCEANPCVCHTGFRSVRAQPPAPALMRNPLDPKFEAK